MSRYEIRRAGRVMLLGLLMLLVYGCGGSKYLRTEAAGPQAITGTYTLLLHGARYGDDMQNVAILDREGDGYTFELHAPEYDYKVRKGVAAGDAVSEAERFVRSHYSFAASQWYAIRGEDGSVLGYEVRPLYQPLATGYADILDITYVIKDRKVVCRIQFKPEIERSLSGDREFPIFRRMR